MPEPVVRPSRYTVTCVPPDTAPDAHVWALYVEERRDGTWVVTNGHEWLDADGFWHIACSSQVEACSHDLDTALRLAQEHAPLVRVNGMTAADAIARSKEQQP